MKKTIPWGSEWLIHTRNWKTKRWSNSVVPLQYPNLEPIGSFYICVFPSCRDAPCRWFVWIWRSLRLKFQDLQVVKSQNFDLMAKLKRDIDTWPSDPWTQTYSMKCNTPKWQSKGRLIHYFRQDLCRILNRGSQTPQGHTCEACGICTQTRRVFNCSVSCAALKRRGHVSKHYDSIQII